MQFIMSMLIESGALPQEVVTPLQVYRPPYAAARTGWAGLGWHGAESTVEYSASGTVRSVVSCRVVSCRVVSCGSSFRSPVASALSDGAAAISCADRIES